MSRPLERDAIVEALNERMAWVRENWKRSSPNPAEAEERAERASTLRVTQQTDADEWTPETVKEAEARLGRTLSKEERTFKVRLDTICACGHYGHMHTAVLLGGPDGSPCWAVDCPCYCFPDGLTLAEKRPS